MQKMQKVRTAANIACIGVALALSGCSLFASKPTSSTPVPLAADFKPTVKVHTVWTASVGDAGVYAFAPVLGGTSIYAASADGGISRLDATTGASVWKVKTGMKLTGGVGTDGTTVVVAGEKGTLLAYDVEGKLLWKAQASSEILSAPAVGQGLVIIRSQDNRIAAYDEQTGERKWVAQRTNPSLTIRSSPGILIVPQAAFISLPGGRLSALNLANGGPWWEMAIGDPRGTTELERVSDASGTPLLIGHDICSVAYQGRVGCFDAGTGAQHWVKKFSSAVGVGGDGADIYAADENGDVSAFTRDNGTVLWKNSDLKYRSLSTPVPLGPTVVAGDYEGYVHFFSRENGALVSRIRIDKTPVLLNPLVVGSNVIFQTKSGVLTALALD
ncbi:outer membrane protein assembly factor BamB [Glaciimonas soli]|nr:outer membrane protein assembly factor BamB [Glaciimonas soli]